MIDFYKERLVNENCKIEIGYKCIEFPSKCTTICGDGIIISPEICDDKNIISFDGCGADCLLIEKEYTC